MSLNGQVKALVIKNDWEKTWGFETLGAGVELAEMDIPMNRTRQKEGDNSFWGSWLRDEIR